jgi:hypothetical protein
MTRDQISLVSRTTTETWATAASPAGFRPEQMITSPAPSLGTDESAVAPKVAAGIAVRVVDVAAPWLADIGGDERGSTLEAAVVARVAIRYDDTKADLVHDEEFEAVLFPLTDPVEMSSLVRVDYDDRDLRDDIPANVSYRLTEAPIGSKSFFNDIERGLRDHLTHHLSLEIPANLELELFGRPGESIEDFRERCAIGADDRADSEIAALRDKYEAKATKLRDQIDAAEDRVAVLIEEAESRRTSELFSTAGSLLGGLLGGSKSKTTMVGDLLGDAGTAARRRGGTSTSDRRVDAAENKVQRLVDQYHELESELERDIADITSRWDTAATAISTISVGLERTDVHVDQLVLAWVPTA